ncbi:ribonuclease 3-like protein 3 [Magnolia sinica]|uniref:ribonuclease 3-like protein 3 n=1 Tax=Magnolia sinica TaxID=86752 RepID=UPI00265A00DD|nr:ribonuclease 3-like protein 3 [Magnolia sinica]
MLTSVVEKVIQQATLWYEFLLQRTEIRTRRMTKEKVEEKLVEDVVVLEVNTDEWSCEEVEKILGYRFKDRGLVQEALTHPSYYHPLKPSVTYERLEFVGDSVLNCLMTKELFSSYPELSPGPLTLLRAANVDTEKLARVAVNHGLHRYARHKVLSLEEQIRDFKEAIVDYPIHSNGLIEVPKFLADIVESLLGAVFVDCSYCIDTVWKVFRRLLEPMISPDMLRKHPVSELYELCQKKGMRVTFVKDTWKESTIVEVLVDDQLVGRAMYGHKKEIAQNRAAKDALDNLKSCFLH